MFSTYSCWQLLVNQTKALAKDHATLSEIYTTHLVARLQAVVEDVQRIYKKCREVGYETHEEILRVLQELHTTMKTYQNYQVKPCAAQYRSPFKLLRRDRFHCVTLNRPFYLAQNECKAAETKLRTAETQRLKLQQSIPKEKLERSKKYRLIEKEMLKVCVQWPGRRRPVRNSQHRANLFACICSVK